MPVEGLRPPVPLCQELRLRQIGDDHVRHPDEAAHVLHRLLGDAVIELPFIPHDGVGHHQQVLLPLALDEGADNVHLLRRGQKARGDAVKGEAQLLPHGNGLFHIVGGIQDGELPIIQGVGHQGGGEVVDIMPHVGQNRQHGGQSDLSISRHVVDDQNIFVLLHGPFLLFSSFCFSGFPVTAGPPIPRNQRCRRRGGAFPALSARGKRPAHGPGAPARCPGRGGQGAGAPSAGRRSAPGNSGIPPGR